MGFDEDLPEYSSRLYQIKNLKLNFNGGFRDDRHPKKKETINEFDVIEGPTYKGLNFQGYPIYEYKMKFRRNDI